VFTESGDILQNAVLDNILLDEEWKIVSEDSLKIYDYAYLMHNRAKKQCLATSRGLMLYDSTTGRLSIADARHTSPVHRLDAHGTSELWFGDEDGNILKYTASGDMVHEHHLPYEKIFDFKKIGAVEVAATDKHVLYHLDGSVDDGFTSIS